MLNHTSVPLNRLSGAKGPFGLSGRLILSTTEVPTQVVGFVVSVLIALGLVALIFPMAKRRPVGTPLSWGEAMVASVYVFFIMWWVYGEVPHLWLTWSGNELNWRPDKLLFGPFDVVKPQKFGGWNPLTISYQTLRDLIAVGIYVVALGLNMWLFAWWQKRGKRAAAVPEIATSDFGRPLVKKS